MKGWKDEWMNEWMNEWMKGWINEWMNRCEEARKGGSKDEQINE